jgi:hypothetical protein
MELYHQTDESCAKSILRSGLMYRGPSGLAGGGIYFATSEYHTKHKARKTGVVLKCKVHLGDVKTISKNGDYSITFDSLNNSGYDSVKIPRDNGTEYAIYSYEQIEWIENTTTDERVSNSKFYKNNNSSKSISIGCNCNCGKKLIKTTPEDAYGSSYCRCDGCRDRIDYTTYHCPKNGTHPNGYDLCSDCYVKKNNPKQKVRRESIDELFIPSFIQASSTRRLYNNSLVPPFISGGPVMYAQTPYGGMVFRLG